MPLFSRKDGTLARGVAPYRRIMPFIMRGKNESIAYFEQEIDVERAQAFIEAWNASNATKISFFHLYMWATAQTLATRPRLNRFLAGANLYDRDGIWLSYSAKKSMNDDSPVVVRKCRVDPSATFADLVQQLQGDVSEGRSAKKSSVDQELGIVLALPAFVISLLLVLQRWLDAHNLLPFALIKTDPLYSSMFIANLGSLKLESVYHHLYEYGNIPVFACIGRRKRVVKVAENGELTTALVCHVKYTFDERVEDGLYCAAALDHLRILLEDPEAAGLSAQAGTRLPPKKTRERPLLTGANAPS
ncbi:MAG: Pyruvate/2-oxoglutarate dehydrogenase complex, dihydrolipoamide acyltransferase [Labilithrix sp.]|nr:Pyruvate/2-oxoglutarate dehydrogenase complex, dihydrolipoamide acyltransferase [Labilithrix sp.]